jgi:hypothetical protein
VKARRREGGLAFGVLGFKETNSLVVYNIVPFPLKLNEAKAVIRGVEVLYFWG